MGALTMAQAKAVGADLAKEYRLTIVESDSPLVGITLTALKALLALIPVAGALAIAALAEAEAAMGTVSVTLPLPWGGSLVVLSGSANDSPEEYVRVVSHEAVHGKHILDIGGWQTAVDYIGSKEMRAAAEAPAYSVGLWMQYLLSGTIPSAAGPHAALAGGTYHLPVECQHLAHDVIESHITTMRLGVCPPVAVAVFAHRSLQRHCRAAILAPGHH